MVGHKNNQTAKKWREREREKLADKKGHMDTNSTAILQRSSDTTCKKVRTLLPTSKKVRPSTYVFRPLNKKVRPLNI